MSYYKSKEYERDNYPSREYQPIPKKQASQIRNKQAYPTLEEKRREHQGQSTVKHRSNSITGSSQKAGHLQNLIINVGRDNKRLDLQKFKVYKNMDPYDLGAQVGEGTYGYLVTN
jgi:thioredoxin reductase